MSKKPFRLEFCGESNCGLRGYSTITNDPEVRIIDIDTIEFEASWALITRRSITDAGDASQYQFLIPLGSIAKGAALRAC